MKNLVLETEQAWKSLGKISYGPTDAEISSLKFRRSIYISNDMNKNEKFTNSNIRVVRPGLGLKPKYFNKIITKSKKRC